MNLRESHAQAKAKENHPSVSKWLWDTPNITNFLFLGTDWRRDRNQPTREPYANMPLRQYVVIELFCFLGWTSRENRGNNPLQSGGPKMVNELSLARAHLRDCQKTLARHRRFLGESGVKSGRWTSNYEAYVVQALDRLWRAQCLEVFEDHGNGWFDSPACAQFVNNVDWEASAIASANLAGIFPGVIVSKQGGPW